MSDQICKKILKFQSGGVMPPKGIKAPRIRFKEAPATNSNLPKVRAKIISKAQVGGMLFVPPKYQTKVAEKTFENMGEAMAAPQKSMTYLASGKYQTPSEAMHIKSPLGQVATDLVLDPVNLVGLPLGVAKLHSYLTKSIEGIQKLRQAKQTFKAKEAGLDFLKDWFEHPETVKRIKNMETLSKDDAYNIMLQRTGDTVEAERYANAFPPEYILKNYGPYDVATQPNLFTTKNLDRSYLQPQHRLPANSDGVSKVNGKTYISRDSPEITSTTIHEGMHNVTGNEVNYKMKNIIDEGFGGRDWTMDIGIAGTPTEKYLAEPREVYARIGELRRHFGLKPGEEVTSTISKKIFDDGISGKTPVEAKLFRLMLPGLKEKGTAKGFTNMFNELPVGVGAVVGGASLIPRKQIGGKISQEEMDRANANKTYINKPGSRMTQELKDAYARDEKESNTFSDIGTNLMVLPTQFWPASKEQLAKGRGSWRDRLELGAEAATQGIMNELIPGLSNKFLGKVPNSNISKTFASSTAAGLNRVGELLEAGMKGYKVAKNNIQELTANATPITQVMSSGEVKNVRDISRLVTASKKKDMNPIDLYNLYLKSSLTDRQLKKMTGMDRESLKAVIERTANKKSGESTSDILFSNRPDVRETLRQIEVDDPDFIYRRRESIQNQLRNTDSPTVTAHNGYFNEDRFRAARLNAETEIRDASPPTITPNVRPFTRINPGAQLGDSEVNHILRSVNSPQELIIFRQINPHLTPDSRFSDEAFMNSYYSRNPGELEHSVNMQSQQRIASSLGEDFDIDLLLSPDHTTGRIDLTRPIRTPQLAGGYDPMYASNLAAQAKRRGLLTAREKGEALGELINRPKLDKSLVPFKRVNDEEVVSNLPSLMDPNGAQQKIQEAFSKTLGGKKGFYNASTSLSDNSLPLYLTKLQELAGQPRSRPVLKGYSRLNSLGNVSSSQLLKPEDVSKFLNTKLQGLNIGKYKIPQTYTKDGQVWYPDIVMQKYKEGGEL